MSSLPIGQHIKASDVSALADLIFRQAQTREVDRDLRDLLASLGTELQLESVAPFWGSLEKDPSQPSAFYLAVDGLTGRRPVPLLLHLTLASAPSSLAFPDAALIGRVRPGGGREVVVHSIPFSSVDYQTIRTYAATIDPAFLPRPQGSQSAIAVGNRHPEISLPAAFDAFRTIQRTMGVNLASTVQLSATREMTSAAAISTRDGENPTEAGHTRVSIEHLYHAGLWAAVRSGWREGYNAEADHVIITGASDSEIAKSVEAGKHAIGLAAGYTKFTTDTSRLFELRADTRHPQSWDQNEVADRLRQTLSAELVSWTHNEFSKPFLTGTGSYQFSREEIERLALKFGRSLLLNEELYDHIRAEKARSNFPAAFDFEPSIDEAETLTTPKEMIFYMHWLQQRGRPAQLVPPNLGFKKRQAYPETRDALVKYAHHKMWPELETAVAAFDNNPLAELAARVAELAAIASHFNGTLSIHSGSGKQPEVLRHIGRSTGGRFNYKISGELQLQLFDVLSEQPAGSYWRELYDRMVERCNDFAARGAFGEESELAKVYGGSFLGTAGSGRTDGNLFLVFWLGNVVGSRDSKSPDGDSRFFKEKLDELPAELLREIRRRNSEYIVWLARHLKGGT
ncbi:MAG TPA: tagaturonate epimerase family protein [Bryobacteraceae bacterium]|nr:tagaturonate epimerase family protein [Bryobacteraceae bacterium]